MFLCFFFCFFFDICSRMKTIASNLRMLYNIFPETRFPGTKYVCVCLGKVDSIIFKIKTCTSLSMTFSSYLQVSSCPINSQLTQFVHTCNLPGPFSLLSMQFLTYSDSICYLFSLAMEYSMYFFSTD